MAADDSGKLWPVRLAQPPALHKLDGTQSRIDTPVVQPACVRTPGYRVHACGDAAGSCKTRYT